MTVKKKISIFWFRQDLRIMDNPGLIEATKKGDVIPVYIFDNVNAVPFQMGAASQWWLYHSLTKLNQKLDHKLNIYKGCAEKILLTLVQDNAIDSVYWNRCYEPWRIRRDSNIKRQLKSLNIDCRTYNGSLLWEPWDVLKSDKTPYRVYSAYFRKGCLQKQNPREPITNIPEGSYIKLCDHGIRDLALLSKNKWYEKIASVWNVGEDSAQILLKDFIGDRLIGYKVKRDFPSLSHTSRLSPHLHFGEISPHQIWQSIYQDNRDIKSSGDIGHFMSELGWREFSYYLLYHFPGLPHDNFQEKFNQFPWKQDMNLLSSWQKGQTGYPIIDAGMRELWQTGYMHNRVRMIVASFLVKNLLVHWHYGRDWFWDCLLDADLANNSASWQWVAGSGADAAPYFRIFNPVTQGEKFDPEGVYTRHFVPELQNLPNKFLFKPWEVPQSILEGCQVILGKTYPKPIINLADSRKKALEAYQYLKSNSYKK